MPTRHPPRPAFPPHPGLAPGEPDENLAALLKGRPRGETAYPVALLMARHWQPVYDYSAICLATSAETASIVCAAAFHTVLDGLARTGSGAALRPQLLVTVRDIVKEWSADPGISGALPDVRKPAGGRGMRVAKTLTPENRKLARRAFRALPGLAQCLLWHTEVEAEHISVPAGLSGMDDRTASATLDQSREQFREGIVRAHRELAPTSECRFNNRLLDVPIRRGGALLPDVQQHLLDCPYCRGAAEQLSHFEGGLGLLLAEAVLGWGARRYLDSRPGRAHRRGTGTRETARSGARPPGAGGRHRLLHGEPAARGAAAVQRNARTLLTGAALFSATVLVTVLATSLWSDDGAPGPGASAGASSRHTVSPAPDAPTASAPPGSAGLPTAPRQTRLRNVAVGLCLDVLGGRAKTGAGTALAACSSTWTQKWSYEKDGLLRSVANPELCLDSRADDGLVVLDRCAAKGEAHGDDVRYDLTVRGELLPRWRDGLAVAPASDDPKAEVVVKIRDTSDEQRWATDSASAAPESLSVAGTARPPTRTGTRTPSAGDGPARPAAGPAHPGGGHGAQRA
ncbi:ricin-type beta-trefoil lectin domain protein [Streptomyces sp. NPDC008313]|uniref:ricin-type beta-trefoil lectin domain protein n=1 Tax=Streptomyces sp. NPDC008313 TaxID=3364826 RepID=UPI0036E41BBB